MAAAQHSKAGEFVRRGIFAGVRDFAELEQRIVALPDEQSRGAAFEVFAEAYLATQRRHDAALVWPLTAVPTQTLQTLGLSAQDYGVDGVFQTRPGPGPDVGWRLSHPRSLAGPCGFRRAPEAAAAAPDRGATKRDSR